MDDTIEVATVVLSTTTPTSSLNTPPFVSSLRSKTRHTYCTAREAEVGVETEPESEADITTDSGEDTEDLVDSDDGDDFNPAGDDEDLQDLNMV
jgi:hypothetical protein